MGIVIIAPVFRKRAAQLAADESIERDQTMERFHGVYVFDVSQTDGPPLPEPAGINGDPGQQDRPRNRSRGRRLPRPHPEVHRRDYRGRPFTVPTPQAGGGGLTRVLATRSVSDA